MSLSGALKSWAILAKAVTIILAETSLFFMIYLKIFSKNHFQENLKLFVHREEDARKNVRALQRQLLELKKSKEVIISIPSIVFITFFVARFKHISCTLFLVQSYHIGLWL